MPSIIKHIDHSNHLHNRNQLTELKEINNNIKTVSENVNYSNNKVKITSDGGISLYADSSPTPIQDDNDRKGWLYKKLSTGSDKFNYYFYSKGNTSLKLKDLKTITSNISIDKYATVNDLPFYNVYTTMTGSGDAGSWYKSKITYTLSNNEIIMIGENIEFYSGLKPINYNGNRQVECNNKSLIVGTANDEEEILTISLGSDSDADLGVKILVSSLGVDFFEDVNKIQSRIELVI
jgi:hypothetical protein